MSHVDQGFDQYFHRVKKIVLDGVYIRIGSWYLLQDENLVIECKYYIATS